MMLRLFLAIPLPKNIIQKILYEMKLPAFYRIISPENMHITLFFLGDTPVEKIGGLKEELDGLLSGFNPFKLEINSFGQFPDKGLPRIIFMTGMTGKNELELLSESIRIVLSKSGFTDDKRFKYHITVARLNERMKADSGFLLPEFKDRLSFNVENVILYKSDLRKSGPVYIPVCEWTLTK